ncbi:MAG: hypothetical protein KGM24_11440 [Elusimicrobia bacterium]|nr:hypothetical protein [Elusimicrobiota bacterium]
MWSGPNRRAIDQKEIIESSEKVEETAALRTVSALVAKPENAREFAARIVVSERQDLKQAELAELARLLALFAKSAARQEFEARGLDKSGKWN